MAASALKRLTSSALPVGVLLVLVLVALHFMSGALQNTEELSRLFIPLLVASVLGLFALVILVGINIYQLAVRYRRQASGSRLTLRMVAIFAVLSLAPVTIVYYYSQQFLMRGIDSWFDVQIDQAMEDALHLGQAALDLHKREKLKTTYLILAELRDNSILGLSISLEDLLGRVDATELVLMENSGSVITSVNVDPTVLIPKPLDNTTLQLMRLGKESVSLEPSGNEGDLSEVKVVIRDSLHNRLLLARYPTTAKIGQLSSSVEMAYNRYKELAFLRESLKGTFTLSLAMVLLFSLLAAIWAAFYSARRLVSPIANIADGTRAITEGDYGTQLPVPKARDELGFLVSSFNAMTHRIAQSRDDAAHSQRQVEIQRAYLQAVLGSLSSGVIAFDSNARVQTVNNAAMEILCIDDIDISGHSLEQLAVVSQGMAQFVAAIQSPVQDSMPSWSEHVTLMGDEGRQVLLCRGASFEQMEEESVGYALIFDDITALMKAQRDAAWGEVARRLAHEIKNPLTPIQLSAERLRHKYLHKMDAKDAEVLDRATHTIVQQVEAMKEMVNAFSDYARPSRLMPEPIKLDALIQEVVDLYRSAGMVVGLQVALSIPQVEVDADPVRLRQVVHNLIKNAQEAVASAETPEITLSSHCVKNGDALFAEFRVMDNGSGFDQDTLHHAFEPYVTTKVKGTGLGLAVVKKIVEEHGGSIWAENRQQGGACIVLRLPSRCDMTGHENCIASSEPASEVKVQ